MKLSKAAVRIDDPRPLELEFGAVLPELSICYESWGELSPERDNAVLICPAFSAHSHANSHPQNGEPGWWEGMIGPGCALDTDRFFVLCPSLLGGIHGTTGPRSTDPQTGTSYGANFPVISVGDLVAVHLRLLDALGIEELHAVVGGSLGAMEALELAIRHPQRSARVIAISGTDATRPYTAAVRHLGRRAIQLGGDPSSAPSEAQAMEGLRLAREIGTLFYRSREEFNQRFTWKPISEPSRDGVTFEVQSYLQHQAKKVVDHFDPNSYQTLSLAMDLHDVWRDFPSRREALQRVDAEFLLIGCCHDHLIPIAEQEAVHQLLVDNGKQSTWRPILSKIGHDAFLVEIGLMTRLLRAFLRQDALPLTAEMTR